MLNYLKRCWARPYYGYVVCIKFHHLFTNAFIFFLFLLLLGLHFSVAKSKSVGPLTCLHGSLLATSKSRWLSVRWECIWLSSTKGYMTFEIAWSVGNWRDRHTSFLFLYQLKRLSSSVWNMANSSGIAHCHIVSTIQIACLAFSYSLLHHRQVLATATTRVSFRYSPNRFLIQHFFSPLAIQKTQKKSLTSSVYLTGCHGECVNRLLHQQAKEKLDRRCKRFQRWNWWRYPWRTGFRRWGCLWLDFFEHVASIKDQRHSILSLSNNL